MSKLNVFKDKLIKFKIKKKIETSFSFSVLGKILFSSKLPIYLIQFLYFFWFIVFLVLFILF